MGTLETFGDHGFCCLVRWQTPWTAAGSSSIGYHHLESSSSGGSKVRKLWGSCIIRKQCHKWIQINGLSPSQSHIWSDQLRRTMEDPQMILIDIVDVWLDYYVSFWDYSYQVIHIHGLRIGLGPVLKMLIGCSQEQVTLNNQSKKPVTLWDWYDDIILVSVGINAWQDLAIKCSGGIVLFSAGEVLGWPVSGIWSDPKYDSQGAQQRWCGW